MTRPASPTWSIAQIAEEFGVYHPRERTRLNLILRGKRLGFPLEEIRKIVDMYDDQPGEAGQLTYLLDQIGERRLELERRRKDIEDSLAELDNLERRCHEDLSRLTHS